MGKAILSRPTAPCVGPATRASSPLRRPGSGGPAEAAPARQTPQGHQGKLGAAPRRRRDTTDNMALASAKSSALEDNNKAVATGMKWSIEAQAEIPQAMRDEIEAEMATKRV